MRMAFKRRAKIMLAVTTLTFALLVVLTEAAYWLGYRAAQDTGGSGSCVVLIPGYPSRNDGTHHPVQRLRVEAGYSAYQANRCSCIVLSGGVVKNAHIEAESMADIAHALGAPEHNLTIEAHARTTWENIGCSQPYLLGYDRILIVSDSLHVHRAKRYACSQDKSLCSRIYAIGSYQPLALLWWKIPAAAYELRSWIRDLIIYEHTAANNAPICPN
ncbi:MAG TPA: YdcF family protein [Methylobacter sp.]